MPRIPWIKPDKSSQEEVIIFASRFEVTSQKWSFRFIVGTVRLFKQMMTAKGCVGLSLDADLIHGVFCTVSAWTDRSALNRWSALQPHRRIATSLAPSMRSVVLTSWSEKSGALPLRWPDVHTRLTEAKAAQDADGPSSHTEK